MRDDVRSLWARTRVLCRPEDYTLASLDHGNLAAAAALVAAASSPALPASAGGSGAPAFEEFGAGSIAPRAASPVEGADPPTLGERAGASISPAFAALVVERDEVSVTVRSDAWAASPLRAAARAVDGPYRAITLDLPIDLGVCGYLLPAAERLARAGISIVPQCAYLKDHLLVRAAHAARAVELLEALSDECRRNLAAPEAPWEGAGEQPTR